MKQVFVFVSITVAAGLSACTSFDSIDRNVCGNGLLEPGEDCDSGDASCVRCAVLCTAATDCPTTDYTCGVDGLCHAPGGALAQPRVVGSFESNDYRVTDIDHDGTGDAIGLSRTSIVVRFGDASAPLSRVESLVTPSQTGPAAFGDLDNDGTLDVTVATPDGLVSYTSTYGNLSPLDVQTDLVGQSGEALNMKRIYTIGPLTVGAFVEVNGNLAHIVADFLDPTNPVGGAPCGQVIPIASFSPDNIDIHQTSRTTANATDYVVTLVTGTGATKRLCVMAIHKDSFFATPAIYDITPPTPPMMAHVPILADLTADTDLCPSLINVDGGPMGLRKWDGVMQTGVGAHCVFKPTPAMGDVMQPLAAAGPNATFIGHAPLVPGVFNIAGDALVLSDGVYTYEPAATVKYRAVYRSTRRLARVAADDINADGHYDLALGADGQDDLDILYRLDNPYFGVLNDSLFELRRIDTAGAVSTISIDDFDGNGKIDVAYTEPVAGHQRLMILYSTGGDLANSGVEVGAFPAVSSIARIAFGDSSDQLSIAKDLLVLLPGTPAKATLLHGSPQRTMLAYFDPRSAAGSNSVRDSTIFRATAIGQFAPTSGTDYPDIVGLAPPKVSVTGQGSVRAWSVPVTADGLDGTQSDGLVFNNVADCSNGPAGSNLCIEDAKYLAWPVATDRDIVFAVDSAATPHAAVFDPRSAAAGTLTAMPATLPIPANTTIRSLHSGDVDGDGVADLIATFAPNSKGPMNSAVLVCQMNSSGMPSACEDLAPKIIAAAPATVACLDAAPGRIGYRDPSIKPSVGLDLLVLCRDTGSTLYRVTKTADGYTVSALTHVAGSLGAIQVGDVTGDGVDDVIGLEGEAGGRSLVVFPQCTSRDSATCARTGEE